MCCVDSPTGDTRPRVITTAVRGLLQPFARDLAQVEPVIARTGDEVDLDALAHRLVEFGYLAHRPG